MANRRRKSPYGGDGPNFAADDLIGKLAVDRDGNSIGKVVDLYQDPEFSVALLARVKLPDDPGYVVIPTVSASVEDDKIRVQVARERLRQHRAAKSGHSTVISATRVREVYRLMDVGIPESVTTKFPKAVRATAQRRGRVIFPGSHAEDIFAKAPRKSE